MATTDSPPARYRIAEVARRAWDSSTSTGAGVSTAVRPRTLAPIQGIRLRDGTWVGVGPNWMQQPALAMKVEFIEQGLHNHWEHVSDELSFAERNEGEE
jgi:hypothetical protein